jgi:threonine 3-dehydrogenase
MLGLPAGSIDIDWAKVVTHMITIQGIYGRQMFETWYAMSAMLRHGAELQKAITSVVTDRFPASFWADAFAAARAADRGKVVIDWTQ